jgi:general secretion pathway protein A
MYREFYGFRDKPFQIVPNPAYLYKSLQHNKALSYLEYGLRENPGFILLTGEIGSGKTTLIQYMLTHLDPETEVGVVFNTNVTADQLLEMILKEFGLALQQSKAEMLDALNHYLIQQYADNKKTVLIIDEGQNLSDEALEEVRMLSNLQSNGRVLLHIVLVGQTELKARLLKPSMRQFAQRIALNYHLTNLSLKETAHYIAHRLQTAGGRPKLFTPEAVEDIYRLTGGIPRSINIACQAALVYGFAYEARSISQDITRQLIEDEVGISQDPALKGAAKETETPVSPASANGFGRRLDDIEGRIVSLTELVGRSVHQLDKDAEHSRKELVERLVRMLRAERAQNQMLVKRLRTLEMKYLASRNVRKKLEKYILSTMQPK